METVNYADGSSATGPGPLPGFSPEEQAMAPFKDWPQYRLDTSIQAVIRAAKIVFVGPEDLRRSVGAPDKIIIIVKPVVSEHELGAPQFFEPSLDGWLIARAKIGDYAVVYPGGFKSICAKAEFEAIFVPMAFVPDGNLPETA